MADETKRQPRDPVAALKEVFEALDFYRVAHECPFPAGGEVCHTEARLGAAILNAKPALDRLAAENAELRRIGAQMANLCFNLSQDATALLPEHRTAMRDLQRQWDEAVRHGR